MELLSLWFVYMFSYRDYDVLLLFSSSMLIRCAGNTRRSRTARRCNTLARPLKATFHDTSGEIPLTLKKSEK